MGCVPATSRKYSDMDIISFLRLQRKWNLTREFLAHWGFPNIPLWWELLAWRGVQQTHGSKKGGSLVPLIIRIVVADVASSLRRRPYRVRAATTFVSMHELRWCWNNIPTIYTIRITFTTITHAQEYTDNERDSNPETRAQ